MQYISELVAVLMTLAGIGISPNSANPSTDDILRYAPKDAEIAAFVDVAAVAPSNYQSFAKLPSHKLIQSDRHLHNKLKQQLRELDGYRSFVRNMGGFDPINDIRWVAMWVHNPTGSAPRPLAVVNGNFPPDMFDRLSMFGKPKKIGGNSALMLPDGRTMLGHITTRGIVLAGDETWVRARLAKTWRPRARNAALSKAFVRLLSGSATAGTKPAIALGIRPSTRSRSATLAQLSPTDDRFVRDILASIEFGGAAITQTGLAWTVRARSRQSHKRIELLTRALLDGMKGLQLLSHAGLVGAIASLDSFRSDPGVRPLLKYKKDLLQVARSVAGGSFTSTVDTRPAQRTVTAHAWGTKLIDVLPMAAIGAGAWFTLSSPAPQKATHPGLLEVPKAPHTMPPRPAKRQPRGLHLKRTYNRAKAERKKRALP